MPSPLTTKTSNAEINRTHLTILIHLNIRVQIRQYRRDQLILYRDDRVETVIVYDAFKYASTPQSNMCLVGRNGH